MALNEKFNLRDRSNILLLVLLGAAGFMAAALVLIGGAQGAAKAPVLPFLLGGVGVLLTAAAIWLATTLSGGSPGGRSAASEDQSQRTQEAILRLLDEMSLLADGDLTMQATVSEDITGAIADSINYTVEALRDLVRTINDTATQLAGATDQTLGTSRELVAASERQAQQIISTVSVIQRLIAAIQQVSASAAQTAQETERSVQVALNGGEAVRRTIDGMTSVREQIQETAKRIKRLGESSQEIGNIIELINDIAEQTNTQALNASIQAAMAGDAGRGFAVVADEVQRLAERAAASTRQIETLVKTIQADTNEAVISMEKTTAGVVSGARLAENAGASLIEIEQSARQIADRVRSISAAAQEQAKQAGGVSTTIDSIRVVTEQTADGTRETGESIGRLAELANQLRRSVSGFKLPA